MQKNKYLGKVKHVIYQIYKLLQPHREKLTNSVSNHLTFLFPSKKLYTWKNVCSESTGGCSFPIWIPKDLRIIHVVRTQIFLKS